MEAEPPVLDYFSSERQSLSAHHGGKAAFPNYCLILVAETRSSRGGHPPYIRIFEKRTSLRALTYNAHMPGFFEVMIERNFSSAHQLRGYKGKCENLHGHNYKIEIFARGEELNNIGLLIDFGDLKSAADEIVKYLDHRNINELPPFDEELNPSAENLARYILEYVNGRVADDRVQVYKVRCFETPTSVATYQIG
jgi:6-pyruvoyltetrahydropterin/6-carboxytetrahydropterin synthase